MTQTTSMLDQDTSESPPPQMPQRQDEDRMDNLDPAQQSLADALKWSFLILKIVMAVLVIVFLFSSSFFVEANEVALRLHFGEIMGVDRGEAVLKPGRAYFQLPYPIQDHIKIPTTEQRLRLDEQFVMKIRDRSLSKTDAEIAASGRNQLDPTIDGYLITGDFNIVHTRWTVDYRITDVVEYVKNIGRLDRAKKLVEVIAEQAVVHAISQRAYDQVTGEGTDTAAQVKRLMQEVLEEKLQSGITVTNVGMLTSYPPIPLIEVFNSVGNAEAIRAKLIQEAQTDWNNVLAEAAGEAHKPLWAMIQQYEQVSDRGDRQRLEQLDAQLDRVFTDLQIGEANIKVGGEVARIIQQARAYRDMVVQELKGEEDRFLALLPEYRRNPQVVLSRLWEQAKVEVFASDSVEIFYVPEGTGITVGRDPVLNREREKKRLHEQRMDRLSQKSTLVEAGLAAPKPETE